MGWSRAPDGWYLGLRPGGTPSSSCGRRPSRAVGRTTGHGPRPSGVEPLRRRRLRVRFVSRPATQAQGRNGRAAVAMPTRATDSPTEQRPARDHAIVATRWGGRRWGNGRGDADRLSERGTLRRVWRQWEKDGVEQFAFGFGTRRSVWTALAASGKPGSGRSGTGGRWRRACASRPSVAATSSAQCVEARRSLTDGFPGRAEPFAAFRVRRQACQAGAEDLRSSPASGFRWKHPGLTVGCTSGPDTDHPGNLANLMTGCRVQQTCKLTRGANRRSRRNGKGGTSSRCGNLEPKGHRPRTIPGSGRAQPERWRGVLWQTPREESE